MQIIVNDTSALIDLRKGRLLEAFLALPFELVIPDTLLGEELITFSERELALIQRDMTVATLDGDGVQAAVELMRNSPALTLNDCFAFLVAKERPGAILLTGDNTLRKIATSGKVEVHGVLWAVELMAAHRTASDKDLIAALEIWRDDSQVRLPHSEIGKLLARLDTRP